MSSDEVNGSAAVVDRMAGALPEPGSAKSDPILVVDGVKRSFGGLTAVDVEHLEVQRGTITALIGPNGAGKSTCFNLLTGFDRVDSGRWTFEGRSINGKRGHQVARAGMVRTFQLTKALTRLSVLDNMLLGAQGQTGERMGGAFLRSVWGRQEKVNTERALDLLERFKLIDKRRDMAGALSGGQRKLLEMARALMTDPSMIMLDEPMAGVNPALVQSLLHHITSLRDEGKTVLFVEHDMDVIMGISDWIVVLAQGRVIAEGRPSDIRSNQQVIDAYLGAQEVEDEGSVSGDE
ncbi:MULTISPECIES: ABC transporter ATP-binding protein [Nocardiopsis]|uniref:ABC transporter ATP-binding protein n=2 Tax=Nocardiopsis alba TaxID=53437 RepID=A0A7K2IXE8_9ACTN|nr:MULTISPECIES: ABC transporter ATP-binding protein [Nocardiopsis]MEC3892101.1 ABC transporter ATP-binding protein [Nocardiopsis sp. LDBS1602]MYR34526.1 ATP-binding cassette domain-containing protein [Nocardiopsis alba]